MWLERVKMAVLFIFLCPLFLFSVEAMYLTYPGQPSRTMAVHWIELVDDKIEKEVSYQDTQGKNWNRVVAEKIPLSEKYVLYRAELKQLIPAQTYTFRIASEDKEYTFATLGENLQDPLVVAIGGDAYQTEHPYQKMNQQVAGKSPHFVIMAGDIAYANQGDAVERWVNFFRLWHSTMKTQSGLLIPLVVTTGNHDMLSKKEGRGQLFLQFFPYFEEGSYGMLPVNDKVCFFLLDTGHIAPIEGRQTQWLKKALQEKESIEHKIPIYHVAAYPSIYKYDLPVSAKLRRLWCPSFEERGVEVVFEQHNHAFKRTVPIRQEKMDPTGIVYIGDGCWSAGVRKKSDSRWYLEKRMSCNAFSLLTVTKEGMQVDSFNLKGNLIDSWKKQ